MLVLGKAKLSNNAISSNMFICEFSYVMNGSTVNLTKNWQNFEIDIESNHIEFNADNADIIIQELPDKIEKCAITANSISFEKPVKASLSLRCNCIDFSNLTSDNFKMEPRFLGTTKFIFDKPFLLTNKDEVSFFQYYENNYISNNFVLTENVKNISNLFFRSNIKALPTKFKINRDIHEMSDLCSHCKKLTTVSPMLIGTFSKKRYPNLCTPKRMFFNCIKLKNIPIKFYKKHYIQHKSKLQTNFVGLLSYIHEL